MCINLGGGGDKKAVRVRKEELPTTTPNKKDGPKYTLPVGDPTPGSPGYGMWKKHNPGAAQEQLEQLMEGPAPTVLDPVKSSLALGSRRRKLIESFKYGLGSQISRRTRADVQSIKNRVPGKVYST